MKLYETLITCRQLSDDRYLLVRSTWTDGGIGGELDRGGGGDIDILGDSLEVGLDRAIARRQRQRGQKTLRRDEGKQQDQNFCHSHPGEETNGSIVNVLTC